MDERCSHWMSNRQKLPSLTTLRSASVSELPLGLTTYDPEGDPERRGAALASDMAPAVTGHG